MTTLHLHGVVEMNGRYLAVIHKVGKLTPLGVYETAEEAAMVYDSVAFAMFGDFAVLNFPDLFESSL